MSAARSSHADRRRQARPSIINPATTIKIKGKPKPKNESGQALTGLI